MAGSDERRQAFRAEISIPARVHAGSPNGRQLQATLLNISAGGALLQLREELQPGAQVGIEVPLPVAVAEATGAPALVMSCEVIGSSTSVPAADAGQVDTRNGGWFSRLAHQDGEGTATYEAVRKAVFALQREELARRSGADESSPMAEDPEDRRARRNRPAERFSPRSLGRPGSDI